jgi:ABC-2 type transport system permease protein
MYLALTRIAFQRQLAYRAAALAGLSTNIFFGMLRVAVLVALYGARREMAGISLPAAITFTGLTQAIISFHSLFGWYEMMNSIYTGAVASDLLKPMGYFRFWLAQDLGRALAQLLLRGLPMLAIYALLFGITLPQTAIQWLALIVSLFLSWLVGFAFRFWVNLAGFWTPDARAIGRLAFVLVYFLSGFLMPLRFFPDWFVRLCALTPFPSIVNTVVEVYLGVLQGPSLILALLQQVAWAALLIAACQLTLRAGVRRLVIQGG